MQANSRPGEPGLDRPPLLPADLPQALTWLSDRELVELASAVAMEQERRRSKPLAAVALDGKTVQGSAAPAAVRKFRPSEHAPARLPPARINAIKAAVRAGVKPSVIARQFGVTQATIREALSEPPSGDGAARGTT
jgi:hypothetical protein